MAYPQWSLGDIPVPSLFSLCEDALTFSVPKDDFLSHLQAIDIFRRMTRKEQNHLRHINFCNTLGFYVKLSEDRIIPRLSVENGGHVRLHLNTFLHGKRKLKYFVPTKNIFKTHKANQVTQIKHLLNTTKTSHEQITAILNILQK